MSESHIALPVHEAVKLFPMMTAGDIEAEAIERAGIKVTFRRPQAQRRASNARWSPLDEASLAPGRLRRRTTSTRSRSLAT
jgi:hypothetical protein